MPPDLFQRVLGFALLLFAGLVVLVVAVTVRTFMGLTRPTRRTYGWAVARGLPGTPEELADGGDPPRWTAWTFKSRGRDLNVWEITGAGDEDAPVAILTHSWGGGRIEMLARARLLLPHASKVLVWDMPGHGDSPGSTTLGVREPEDLLELMDVIAGRGDDAPPPIILYGWSLGATVSAAAARRMTANGRTPAALILETPPRSTASAARAQFDAFELPVFINLGLALGAVAARAGKPVGGGSARRAMSDTMTVPPGVPTIILTGGNDPIAPPTDADAIRAASPDADLEIVLIEDAGHAGTHAAPMANAAIDRLLTRS